MLWQVSPHWRVISHTHPPKPIVRRPSEDDMSLFIRRSLNILWDGMLDGQFSTWLLVRSLSSSCRRSSCSVRRSFSAAATQLPSSAARAASSQRCCSTSTGQWSLLTKSLGGVQKKGRGGGGGTISLFRNFLTLCFYITFNINSPHSSVLPISSILVSLFCPW